MSNARNSTTAALVFHHEKVMKYGVVCAQEKGLESIGKTQILHRFGPPISHSSLLAWSFHYGCLPIYKCTEFDYHVKITYIIYNDMYTSTTMR